MPWINRDLKKKQPSIQIKKEEKEHRSNVLENRRDLQKTIRQAIWDHVKGITAQKDEKGFWRYVKKFTKDNTGIVVLKKGGSATSSHQKVEILNAQFSTVLTQEDTEYLLPLKKQCPSLSILNISANGVEKLLLNLNASKSLKNVWCSAFYLLHK